MSERTKTPPTTEWKTVLLLALCYLIWAIATTWIWGIWPPLAIAVTTLTIALFCSLQHEVLHGHPFPNQWLNEALIFPGLTLAIPYLRFRDQHLAHHNDSRLTDPYDDPETNFLDPEVWGNLTRPKQLLLRFNNTLLGRLTIGVVVSQVAFMSADWRYVRAGNRSILGGWLWHIPSVILVGLWLGMVAQMPVWAYILSAYLGLSILKIRTFLEHRAHPLASGRTVLIEGRGLLAFLFLNNNYHVVHHMHPRAAWYDLPGMFTQNRAHYLKRNDDYYFRSYAQIFRAYFLRTKDPVPHPLWRRD